jgi:phospholipid N-methyltransferase
MNSYLHRAADSARFLWHFIANPLKTGAVSPSSRGLARLMAEEAELDKARLIVDVGAGTGVFTGEALRRARPGTKIVAIEINPDLAVIIRKRYRRVHVISDSVEHLSRHLKRIGHSHADAILCSIPWSHLPRKLQTRLLDSMADCLKPGGHFSSFAYLHSAWWPSARHFNRLLKSRFRMVKRSKVAWLNIPPAFVYRCVKGK